MGDRRYDAPFERVKRASASDRVKAIGSLDHAEVLLALGGAARTGDVYLANVLTTEALNRHRRLLACFAAVAWGAAAFVVPRIVLTFVFASPYTDASETLRIALTVLLLVASGSIASLAYWRARRAGRLLDV